MSSSSQCSAVFPEELMIDILSRVPVKDLMRFRCTSKWMNHLILDRAFVKLHLQRCSKNTNILLTTVDYENNETMYCAASLYLQSLSQNPSSTIDYYCHRFNHHNYSVATAWFACKILTVDFTVKNYGSGFGTYQQG